MNNPTESKNTTFSKNMVEFYDNSQDIDVNPEEVKEEFKKFIIECCEICFNKFKKENCNIKYFRVGICKASYNTSHGNDIYGVKIYVYESYKIHLHIIIKEELCDDNEMEYIKVQFENIPCKRIIDNKEKTFVIMGPKHLHS